MSSCKRCGSFLEKWGVARCVFNCGLATVAKFGQMERLHGAQAVHLSRLRCRGTDPSCNPVQYQIWCTIMVVSSLFIKFHGSWFVWSETDFPIRRLYVARVIVIVLTPTLPAYAYVADVVSPSSRTIAFALNGLVFGLAFAIGPMLVGSGAIPGVTTACYLCVGFATFSCIACLVFIPESLTEDTMECSKASLEFSTNRVRSCSPRVVRTVATFWGSLSILFRNDLFRKLTLCILALNLNKVHDMEAQYFQEVAHFGTKDLARLFTIAGMTGLFITTVGIWTMVSLFRMTDKSILIVGMSGLAIQRILYMLLRQKQGIFVAAALGAVANLVFPSINSIKTRNVGVDEQGALQGAIVAVQSVAKGVSPFLFLLFFKLFRTHGLYFPGAPFLVGFLLLVGGIALAFTLSIARPPGRPPVYAREGTSHLETQPFLKTHSIALSSVDSEDSSTLNP